MDNEGVFARRLFIYLVCLFLLALGASLSIKANLGVSPITSLAYSISLTSGISIGIAVISANIIYIFIQIILRKHIDLKNISIQIIISLLFGLFSDLTMQSLNLLPVANNTFIQYLYLIASLFVIASGLLGYLTVKLPIMPYESLMYTLNERTHQTLGKTKIICDFSNVILAAALCLIFIHSLGSIGIGTLISAYFIGKILDWLMKHYQTVIQKWAYRETTA